MPSLIDLIRKRRENSGEAPKSWFDDQDSLEAEVLSGVGLDVRELAVKISEERGVSASDVMKEIYRAVEKGTVKLVDPSPPKNILGFLSLNYSAWFWLVIGLVGLVFLTIFFIPQSYPFNFLRGGLSIIFLIYLPGYTLIEALYSRKAELEKIERFGLSIGLSVAVVPLIGLALNYLPWGIKLEPALMAVSLFILLFAFVSLYRKYSLWRIVIDV